MKHWANYLFHRDFSEHSTYLSTLPLGELNAGNADALCAVLNDIDTGEGAGQWTDNPLVEDWSLAGATIEYSGPNAQSLPTKSKFTNVMVVKFPLGSVKPSGKLYLQYN